MEAGASDNKGPECNRLLEVREEELDMEKVSKLEVDVGCMCCVWISYLYLEVVVVEEVEEAAEVGVRCLVSVQPRG